MSDPDATFNEELEDTQDLELDEDWMSEMGYEHCCFCNAYVSVFDVECDNCQAGLK
jgi:hypothetical protein